MSQGGISDETDAPVSLYSRKKESTMKYFQCRSFSELFTSAQKADGGVYCIVDKPTGFHTSIYIKPLDILKEWMKKNMLEGYSVFFQILIRDNEDADIFVNYDTIIGSRYLARIDPKTIPGISLSLD